MSLKPFLSIPGPRSVPLIGSLYKYFPWTGEYSFQRLHISNRLKYEQFGPLVRERLGGNTNMVSVYDPNDIAKVFANDGSFPHRRSHTALQKYRLDRPHMYTNGGLLPTNGEEWWKLRKEAQKVMTRLECVRAHLPAFNDICLDFVELINAQKNSKSEIDDFLVYLKRAFMEMNLTSNLDVSFGSLRPDDNWLNSEASELLKDAEESTKSILATDSQIPFWKYFPTPLFRKIQISQDMIYKIADKYLIKKTNELKARTEKQQENSWTTLEFAILQSSLTRKDIATVICDALLAGVDTSSYSMSFVLYHLAKCPEKQEVLAREVDELFRSLGSQVTLKSLNEAKYLKAVVKESFRLNPISVGVGRIATKDFELRGFNIPRNTVIVTQNQVACQLERNFRNANQFQPERWLERNQCHPFLLLPFGHGPRACIGRRLAEQSIYVLLMHIVRNFHIEWRGAPVLDTYSNLINEPDSELKFKFVRRN